MERSSTLAVPLNSRRSGIEPCFLIVALKARPRGSPGGFDPGIS